MTKQTSVVLYDVLGPRGRRRMVVLSIVLAALTAAGAYFLVYLPLERRGEFTMDKWGPLVDPANPLFGPLWKALGRGFRATAIAALFAIVSSLVFGTALALLRVQLTALRRRRFAGVPAPAAYALSGLSWLIRFVTRFFVEVFRGMPVVITIFFVFVVLPEFGLDLGSLLWYLVIGLSLYNGVVIGEILRSGMEGLPGGQREAAQSLGLTSFQTARMILLPQAYRIMLPALISQIVVILKDTSLGFIISYEEVLRVVSLAIPVLDTPNPIQMYFVVGIIYIAVNFALSKLAEYLQRRLARGRKAPGPALAPPAAVATESQAA